jgi:hypothetical protein
MDGSEHCYYHAIIIIYLLCISHRALPLEPVYIFDHHMPISVFGRCRMGITE